MGSISLPCHLYTPPQATRCSPVSSFGTWNTGKIRTLSASILLGPQRLYLNHNAFRNDSLMGANILLNFLVTHLTPALTTYSRRKSSSVVCSDVSSLYLVCDDCEREPSLVQSDNYRIGVDCVDYLVQILHESAKSFSFNLQCHDSARNYQKVAKAWIGVDVDVWYNHIAHQAVAYALVQTAMELATVHIGNHAKDSDLVSRVLSRKISLLVDCIESKLSTMDPKLVKWFRVEQLPVLTKYFTPLLERWFQEYTESSPVVRDEETSLREKKSSGVAVIVQAASCCVAVMKLGARHISCPSFTMFLPDIIAELLDLSHGRVPMDLLHKLATKAGFEYEFLSHFGSKVLQHDASQDLVFWMGLLQEKLVVAFQRESVVESLQSFCNSKVRSGDLATLGLFAFLGRKTRFFLSRMGIKDFDEPVKDFLCYLECGILFFYPGLSSMCVYQIFMEVMTEEIGWLDYYAEVPSIKHQERKRSKQHAIQAEKEIILSIVLNVCSDVFSSFAQFSNKTQQSVDSNLVEYLLRSQSLLKVCQVDFLAAYDKSRKLLKPTRVNILESIPHLGCLDTVNACISFEELPRNSEAFMTKEDNECIPQSLSEMNKSFCSDQILEKSPDPEETDPTKQNLFTRSSNSLLSRTSDIWMGTQLLFVDLSVALGFIRKLICGHSLSKWERKRITRTAVDVASVIPIAILMLLPVTCIGHAAILAAIKTYIPGMIPSPYSRERLDSLKQLRRAKKMVSQSWWSNTNVGPLQVNMVV